VVLFVLGSFDITYPGPRRTGYLHNYFSRQCLAPGFVAVFLPLLTSLSAVYKQYGSTILGSIYFWKAKPIFWVADADAHRIVTTNLKTFNKALELVKT
jgi:hypothetical protein